MTDTTNHSGNPDDLSSLVIFRIIKERLEAAIAREEEIDYRGIRDTQRTFFIGRIALGGLLLLAIPVFYLIWTLVGAMGTITDRMEQMKVQVMTMRRDFDEVARLIQAIEGSVASMRQNIAVIPPIEQQVFTMREDFDVMRVAMDRIAPNLVTIDQILQVMDRDMGQMNQVFSLVNRDVFHMRKNVNEMSSPLRMMPFFNW